MTKNLSAVWRSVILKLPFLNDYFGVLGIFSLQSAPVLDTTFWGPYLGPPERWVENIIEGFMLGLVYRPHETFLAPGFQSLKRVLQSDLATQH